MLKVSAVSGCKFTPSEHKTIVPKEIHLARINPRKGSIIISRSNTPELVGHSAYIHQDYPNLYLPDKLWQTVFRKGARVDSVWLSQALASEEMLRRISSTATGSSNSMKNISKETFLNFPIWFPPLPEQRQIAAVLGTWDRAIEQTTDLLKQLRTRHRGLMQRLLTGKVRLPGFKDEWQAVNANEVFRNVSIRNHPNEPLLSATQEYGVIPRSMLEGRVTMPEGETGGYKLVVPGDFIISLRSFQGGIETSDYRGIVSPAYTVLKPKVAIDDNFYRHYFKSIRFIRQLGVAIIGIRDGKQISFEDFSASTLR